MADDNNSLSELMDDDSVFFGSNETDQDIIYDNVSNAINNTGESIQNTSVPLERNKSMFDSSAFIDYAKYVTSTVWFDNQSDREEKGKGSVYVNSEFKGKNTPVEDRNSEYLGEDGLTINSLIKWSEQYKTLRLKYQDFVYCKALGYYPNNRLIILRRFKNAVPDNLFDHVHSDSNNLNNDRYSFPLSTMITWMKPDQNFFSMEFNEEWVSESGDILSQLNGLKTENKSNTNNNSESVFNSSLFNLADSTVLLGLVEGLGIVEREDGTSVFGQDPEGNPNLIRKAAFRKTGGEGLKSTINFELNFEYEMRYIQDVDPGIAMMDLISNCFRMGTSTSQFRLDYGILKNDMIKDLLNQEFNTIYEQLFEKLQEFFGGLREKFTEWINKAVENVSENDNVTAEEVGGNLTDKVIKTIISRYRERIKGALASETGVPSGIWHVSIGNPMNPIISCGDLIIDNSKLELGKELGFNDFPNSFKYTINLKSARDRGRQELEKIFNAGRGRFYVYPNKESNPDFYFYPKGENTEDGN